MPDEDKKVVVPSSADSSIKPSDMTRIAPAAQPSIEPRKLKTIKLKPLKTVAPASPNDEETVSLKREKLAAEQPRQAGEDDATVGIDKMKSSKSPMMNVETVLAPPMPSEVSGEATAEDDATVKIEKVAKRPTAPSIPGVKQTIKLRPSSSVSDAASPDAGPAPASTKQTLKLTPSQPSATAPEAPPAAASSAKDEPKRTIKLVAKKPSAPTVKLDSPASAPTVATPPPEGPAATGTQTAKRPLKIKTPGSSAPPPPAPASSDVGMATEHGAAPMAEPSVSAQQHQQQMQYPGQQGEQASAISTIAASLTLVALGYFAFQLFSQYKSLFM